MRRRPACDGLAAYGDDMMMALARKIVSGGEEEDEAETMEEFSVFQSTQKSTVLMGSRFGCIWSSIGTAGFGGYISPHLW